MNDTAPGWYGKVPALGDFASRRLPTAFVQRWDEWLQRCIAASRSQLGAGWLDAYLTSPLWRFMLLPGTCSDGAWAGVMMPSVDKVGRHFPLTIACQLGGGDALVADSWYAGVEDIALATLDINFPAEQLDQRLAALEPPTKPVDAAMSVHGGDLAHWWNDPLPGEFALSPASLSQCGALFAAARARLFASTGFGRSLWWSGDDASARLHGFLGLPPPESFATLLTGAAAASSQATP